MPATVIERRVLVANEQDAREYLRSKQIKREPLRCHLDGVAQAESSPASSAAFSALVLALTSSTDFGSAADRILALEAEVRKTCGRRLPCPRKVIQNPDRSVSLFWDQITVRAFGGGIVSLIGGVPLAKGIKPELVRALCLLAMQGQVA